MGDTPGSNLNFAQITRLRPSSPPLVMASLREGLRHHLDQELAARPLHVDEPANLRPNRSIGHL
jgi:hypothetical protein